MAHQALNCWHCGTSLADLPLPIGRREECPHCSVSLHVCRQCDFFDRNASKDCREPMADEVTDKEQSNFCDYFRPRSGLGGAMDDEAARSRARLEALFGTSEGAGAPKRPGPASLRRPGSEPDPEPK